MVNLPRISPAPQKDDVCVYCEDDKILARGQICNCRLHSNIQAYQNRLETIYNTVQSWKVSNLSISAAKLEEVLFNIDKEYPLK